VAKLLGDRPTALRDLAVKKGNEKMSSKHIRLGRHNSLVTVYFCCYCLLYQFGCFTRNMMPVVDHMNEVFCANVYDEASQIADAGFAYHQRDLFMEQSAFTSVVYCFQPAAFQ